MKKVFFLALLVAVALTACKDKPKPGPDTKVDPNTIATANLVAYFPFDGNGIDQVHNLTPAEAVGVEYVIGRRGQAYHGLGDVDAASYLKYDLPANSPLKDLKGYSVALWYKLAPTTDGGPEPMIFQINGTGDWIWGNLSLLQSRTGYAEGVQSEFSNLVARFYKDDAAAWKNQGVSFNDNPFNRWTHLVISYDNTTSKFNIYQNGIVYNPEDWAGIDRVQEENGAPLGDLKFVNATMLVFGAWYARVTGEQADDWEGYFKGNIDEFRIYNKGLSATEAKALYDAEVSQIN